MTARRCGEGERYAEAISAFVDGSIDPGDRARVERHLETCAACRGLAADLRQIRRTASALDRRRPPADAWPRLAARLQAPPPIRASRWNAMPAWLAPLAAAAILVVAVGLWWRSQPGSLRPEDPAHPPAAAPARDSAASIETELQLAAEHYERAIAGLEQIAKSDRETLDPQVAATLQKNLELIDQAISESRAAVRAEPMSQPAQQSLLDAFRSKLGLLQDTVALINEMRKGNQAEAARIVGGIGQGS